MSGFFETHRQVLDAACEATRTRGYWSAYPEMPSGRVYGETAAKDGEDAFNARLGNEFTINGHPSEGLVGTENSPFGLTMGVKYPNVSVDTLVAASNEAATDWANASIETRTGVCLEILSRLNKRSFELAHAVMHTTGQAFMMAFQAGGPHAQDRGLEAVAYAYQEMTRTPANAVWTKPQGKRDPIVMEKSYRVIPRGIALEIGCATFPTWNGYPGLFASLATGNTVIVKPHPMAILPLAITLEIGREVLSEAGFNPNILLLAADEPGAENTKELVAHPEIKVIDFTGSNAFGKWVRDNAGSDCQVYTEEAGVNSIVVSSTDSFRGMCSNIGFSLSLYSGQMCTAPQNVYIPRTGIDTDEGPKSFADVVQGIKISIDKLLGDAERAAGVCGAIANPATLERVKDCASLGTVVRASTPIEGMDDARSATPMLLSVDASETDMHLQERFGPIAFLVAVESTNDGIDRAATSAQEKGAISAGIYATDDAVLEYAEDAFARAGVCLSCNLTGGIFVNQNAAFSDYHVTGANPAGNACLTDAAFVANRFRISAVRKHKAA